MPAILFRYLTWAVCRLSGSRVWRSPPTNRKPPFGGGGGGLISSLVDVVYLQSRQQEFFQGLFFTWFISSRLDKMVSIGRKTLWRDRRIQGPRHWRPHFGDESIGDYRLAIRPDNMEMLR